MHRKFIALILPVLPLLVAAQPTRGKVVAIHDGNTVVFQKPHDDDLYTVVLMDIDCPELTQPFGNRAKQFLEQYLLNTEVVLTIYGKDRLRNYIGVILTKDSADVRHLLLREGLAWTTGKDANSDLERIRLLSVQNQRGLWSDSDPIPPWIYRREQSMTEPKSR